MGTIEYQGIADQIIELQGFCFETFEEARMRLDFTLAEVSYYLDFDRLTLRVYTHNLPDFERRALYRAIFDAWELTANNERKQRRDEYLALYWFLKCTGLDAINIEKSECPDFWLTTRAGKKIAVEHTELTTRIDKARDAAFKKHYKLSIDDAKNIIPCYLKKYKDKLSVVSLGEHFTIIPNEATCLTGQRQFFVNEVWKKYKEIIGIIALTDELILLADALMSSIDLRSESEVDEVLDVLKTRILRSNSSIVILYDNYDHNCVACKAIQCASRSFF